MKTNISSFSADELSNEIKEVLDTLKPNVRDRLTSFVIKNIDALNKVYLQSKKPSSQNIESKEESQINAFSNYKIPKTEAKSNIQTTPKITPIPSTIIVSDTRLKYMKELESINIKKSKVSLKVKTPTSVLEVINDLNDIAKISDDVLGGKQEAQILFRQRLTGTGFDADQPLRKPSPSQLNSLGNALGNLPCQNEIPGIIHVLEAGFHLDLLDRNKDARWTRQAKKYLNNRIKIFNQYITGMERTISESEQPFEVETTGLDESRLTGDR